MSGWITDRLPTEADADDEGDVIVKFRPDDEPPEGFYCGYQVVVPGRPWWSERAEFRAAAPAPAPTPVRGVTALCSFEGRLYAACDDGTVWASEGQVWLQCPSIPQPVVPND